MVMKLQTNKIVLCIIVNVILLLFLYSIPIIENPHLENLCIYKYLFGKECWNCGMTRSFLSILHGEFKMAITYNWKCIIVFPFATLMYIYSWYKFIVKNNS